jgi:hypothetical protein
LIVFPDTRRWEAWIQKRLHERGSWKERGGV